MIDSLEDSKYLAPDQETIDEYELLMLLCLQNWNSFYWILLGVGISCLNFQIYCILLFLNPLFFVTLCASLGIFNPVFIFAFSGLLIFGIGLILATSIYATYIYWISYHQISDNNMLLEVWSCDDIDILKIMPLTKNERFVSFTNQISTYTIPNDIKKSIIQKSTYRKSILNIFNKLQYHIQTLSNSDTFVEDFLNYITKLHNNQNIEIQSKHLFDCLNLLYLYNPPSYSIIQKFLTTPELYQKHYPELEVYKRNLDEDLFYKILLHIEFMPLFEAANEPSNGFVLDTTKIIEELFYFIHHSKIANILNLPTTRPVSPIDFSKYLQKIKITIFKMIWDNFNENPKQFLSIWHNICDHPNADYIFPIIERFCQNQKSPFLYNYIFAISQVGQDNEVNNNNLEQIYKNESDYKFFLSSIQLLIDLNELQPVLFNHVICHSNQKYLNDLLSYYNDNFTSSSNKFKDIFQIVKLSMGANNPINVSIDNEVQSLINDTSLTIPNPPSPTVPRIKRFFSSNINLAKINEEYEEFSSQYSSDSYGSN